MEIFELGFKNIESVYDGAASPLIVDNDLKNDEEL